jgi:hypothetical protein
VAKKKKKAASSVNGSHRPKKVGSEAKQFTLKQLPIKRHISPSMVGVFANNVVIRGDVTNFHLFFFDAQPPLGMEVEAGAKGPDEIEVVDAHCVARVVIPPHIMPSLIQALTLNAEREQEYLKSLGLAAKE